MNNQKSQLFEKIKELNSKLNLNLSSTLITEIEATINQKENPEQYLEQETLREIVYEVWP